VIGGFGCTQNPIMPNMFCVVDCEDNPDASRDLQLAMISQDADQAVELGSAYCRQGANAQGADLYDQATQMYSTAGVDGIERQAAVAAAAAKMNLKAPEREAFLILFARLKGLIRPYKMPTEDEYLLLNLAAHMQKQDLPYPLKPEWRVIFNK
jgi:hypothetical protein